MPRASSPSSDQEEGNDVIMQEELEKLKNQYRILQNDRNKYIEDTQTKLKKYNDEIDHLENENTELQTVLEQAESNQNKKTDEKHLDQLKDLTVQGDDLNAQIEDEKQKIATTEAEIRKLERAKKNLQKQKGGQPVDSVAFQASVEKRTRVMENRLAKQNNVYNDTLTENAELRDEIEKLRNARTIYRKINDRLEDEGKELRREKDELTEKATQAYDQRDEANNKCLALREKNEKDRIQYEMERRDLQRIVDHDNRLRDFMNVKSNDRIEWKKAEEERRKKHGSAGELARQQQRQQIQTYDEAFTRIKEITQKEDLDLIVTEFIKHEDENFAFFQYVSELNNQVETLNEEIESLQDEITRYQAEEVCLEEDRQKILRDLEVDIDHKKQEADKAEARLTEVNKILDQLRTGVKSVFTKIGCDDSVILEMLGGDTDVTDRNLMLYLGSVEQRTNELLGVEYYVQMKQYKDEEREDEPEHGMTLGIAHMPKVQRDAGIMPPAIGDEFDDSSEASADELRPLSQHELRFKVDKEIKKREMKGASRQQTRLMSEGKKARK